MAQITYDNKVALNENPEIANINKVTDDDLNEIKQVVNDNYNNTIQITDTEPTDNDNKLWINSGEIGGQASEITNSYSESTGIGYSANYVNNLHTYSTSEIRVGTWIDGKPIYRIAFESTNYATSYTIPTPTNLEKIIDVKGMLQRSDYNNIWQVIPSRLNNTGFTAQFDNISISGSSVSVGLTFGTSWSTTFRKIIIVFEYTKTTD